MMTDGAEFKRGQIVECVEKPGYLKGLSRGSEYVVSETVRNHGHQYIKFLGDDDEAHTLLASLFRPARS